MSISFIHCKMEGLMHAYNLH